MTYIICPQCGADIDRDCDTCHNRGFIFKDESQSAQVSDADSEQLARSDIIYMAWTLILAAGISLLVFLVIFGSFSIPLLTLCLFIVIGFVLLLSHDD